MKADKKKWKEEEKCFLDKDRGNNSGPNMSDRKAELERKKEKLRLIREEKEKRKREREVADQKSSALKTASGEAGSLSAHQDINAHLREIGINPVDEVLSGISSATADIAATAAAAAAVVKDDSARLEAGAGSLSLGSPRPRKPLQLGITTVHQVS